jgi:hypothetical protein
MCVHVEWSNNAAGPLPKLFMENWLSSRLGAMIAGVVLPDLGTFEFII